MMKKLYFTALVLLAINCGLSAQTPGTFNTNFSTNGWDTVFANNNGFDVFKLLIQSNGKILVCAEANFSNEGHQAVVIRYNTDGTLDTEFGGGDGMVRSFNDYNIYMRGYSMALQNDGKIIVAGDQFYNSERIIRLNQDGSLDSTFGENGLSDFGRPNSEFIYHVGVQSDNKIIICGQESRLSNGSFQPHVFVWRLTADGQLDETFGQAGIVSYINEEWQNVFESYLRINELIILPNDAMLINQSFIGQSNNFVVIRKLNADGSTDNSYGVNGNATKSKIFNEGVFTYSNSALQEDGSVVSIITTRDTSNGKYSESIFRFNGQGVQDPTLNFEFNGNNSFPSKFKVVVLGNKIYVLTQTSQGSGFDKIYCFNLNGGLVSNFGTNGSAELTQNGIPSSRNGAFEISNNGTLYASSSVIFSSQFLTTSIVGFPYESSVGIEMLVPNESFVVYPNPSSETIFIQESSTKLGRYLITDLQGRTVLQTNNSSNFSSIDILNLPNGVYFVRNIITSAQSKFVVLHD